MEIGTKIEKLTLLAIDKELTKLKQKQYGLFQCDLK